MACGDSELRDSDKSRGQFDHTQPKVWAVSLSHVSATSGSFREARRLVMFSFQPS